MIRGRESRGALRCSITHRAVGCIAPAFNSITPGSVFYQLCRPHVVVRSLRRFPDQNSSGPSAVHSCEYCGALPTPFARYYYSSDVYGFLFFFQFLPHRTAVITRGERRALRRRSSNERQRHADSRNALCRRYTSSVHCSSRWSLARRFGATQSSLIRCSTRTPSTKVNTEQYATNRNTILPSPEEKHLCRTTCFYEN